MNERRQFTLRSLLVLAILVAVSLSAYRTGHRNGFDEGKSVGIAMANPKVVWTYRVADLLPKTAGLRGLRDFVPLMDEIITEVAPATWESAGGKATMVPYPQNDALVISQTQQGHDLLVDFLETKREDVAQN